MSLTLFQFHLWRRYINYECFLHKGSLLSYPAATAWQFFLSGDCNVTIRTPMWDWDTAAPLSYSVLSWDSHIHKTVSSFCLHFYWRKRHMGSFAGTTYNHLQCCLYILFSFFLLKCTFISFCYFKTMLLE